MSNPLTKYRSMLALALVATTALTAAAQKNDAPTTPAATPTLQELLFETNLPIKKLGDNYYGVTAEDGFLQVQSFNTNWELDGQTLQAISIVRWIGDVPENFQPSRQLLNLMAELNLKVEFGVLNINQHGLFLYHQIWFDSATPGSLSRSIREAEFTGVWLEEQLKPFLAELES